MRKVKKYLIATLAVAGFLFVFTFTKIPTQTARIVSVVRKTFRQVILKEKSSSFSGYDVVTSASIRIEDSNYPQEKS